MSCSPARRPAWGPSRPGTRCEPGSPGLGKCACAYGDHVPARKTPATPPPTSPAPLDGPAYRLNSVDHALRLLLLFRSKPSVRVSEVADYLNVARSTAHRLLGMLVHRQFAVQDPATRAYRPGPRLGEVGLAALAPRAGPARVGRDLSQ